MYRYDPKTKSMYWNSKLIGATDKYGLRRIEDVGVVKLQQSSDDLPLGGKLACSGVMPNALGKEGQVLRTAGWQDPMDPSPKSSMKFEIGMDDEFKEALNDIVKGMDERDVENMNLHYAASDQRIHLIKHIESLSKRLDELDGRKIDRPSLSPELLDAERYMDDFAEIRKKYRVQRFAQKQRTKNKLARLEKAAEFKKTKNRIPMVLAVALLAVAGFAAGFLI